MLEAATAAYRYPVLAGNKLRSSSVCASHRASCDAGLKPLCTSYHESKPIKYQVIIRTQGSNISN